MQKRSGLSSQTKNLWRYLAGIALLIVASGLAYLVELTISPTNLVMIFLLATVIAALNLGRGPAILVSFLGVLAFDYFFIPPFFTLEVSDTEYIITFAGLLLVGLVISELTVRVSEQAEAARRREAETAALYALSRDLASADDIDSIIKSIQTHINSDVAREAIVYLIEGNHLTAHPANPEVVLPRSEQDLALEVFVLGEPSDREPGCYFMPLKTSQHNIGVLSIRNSQTGKQLTANERLLLEAMASQSAQAIERAYLAEQSRQIKLLQATEKLQNALLNSISHDLRTPLVSITGALTSLEQQNSSLNEKARQSLVETAREEADRLNRLVGNLLEMTRLESGALKVRHDPCDLQDLIGAAIGQMEERLKGRKVRVEVPDGFPLVKMDFVLIVHVLNNLIVNAIKYSPENSDLEIKASAVEDEIHISVMDRGLGIPQDDLEKVFDKFHRVYRPKKQVSGTGLGLAICKGIVEAHGGRIWASKRPVAGTIITIALPKELA